MQKYKNILIFVVQSSKNIVRQSRFLIAATSSGSGKTTLSLGLMRALRRIGLDVQPFKCGPDYIDTQFHHVATGHESINLDTFMASGNHVRYLFGRYSEGKDVSVVEGVMGMFDGYSRMKGSSADIARLIDIPIVLLINAASTAYSVAAIIYGFKNFCPDIKVAGVIFNRVSSESHFSLLKEACVDAGVECFGYLPKMSALQTPSRHLGLTLSAKEEMNAFINTAADAVEAHVDVKGLLSKTSSSVTGQDAVVADSAESFQKAARPRLRVAVAQDEAFSFIYPENINALRRHPDYDCEIIYFSPLHDHKLPDDIDFLYLPGGYPELFADELEANVGMRESIHDYAMADGRIFGECGGMIYLGDRIDGREMCHVLPVETSMTDAKLKLGYRQVDFDGIHFNGHEFHYSHVVDDSRANLKVRTQRNIKGMEVATPYYSFKNTIAGYTHLYWAESDILKLFV
ncbi:MAG: cobyrinate a,c-diamide synthase [Bacteroides sp.]|nr:cobyrinate a,c-diamide synthase [Bacteroides sp.]